MSSNRKQAPARSILLAGVSLIGLTSALAVTLATPAQARDLHFLATSDTLLSTPPGGFESMPTGSDRAIYDRPTMARSQVGTTRVMGQIVFLAPYGGAGFAHHALGGILTIVGLPSLDGEVPSLGIDDQVNQQITLADRLIISSNQVWRISSATGSIRQLNLGGTRNLNLGNFMLTLNAVNAANFFQLDNRILGIGGLTTTGAGTTTLTFANTYSGGTFLNGGALSVSSDGNLGDAAGALSFDGGLLQVTGTTFASTARTINWGPGGGGFDIADPAGVFTVGQVLDGAGGLRKLGAGTLTLTSANTYTGATEIEAGTLILTGGGTVAASSGVEVDGIFDVTGVAVPTVAIKSLSGGGTVKLGAKNLDLTEAAGTFDGVIEGTGGLTLSAGTQVLTGANTYSGGTFLNGGVLSVSSDGNLGASAGAVTLDGGVLQMTGTTFASAVRAITLTLGRGGFDVVGAGGSATLGQAIGGAGALTKLGDGELILTGANTYAGATVIEAGTLALSGSGAIGASSGVQVDGVFNISGVTGPSAAIRSLSGDGTVQLGAKTLDLTLATDTFDGIIQGTGGLTLSGGTQVLTGDNTYTGATDVNGGTLRINGDQRTATGLTTVASGGRLGGSGTVGGDVLIQNGGALAPGNSPGTLSIAGDLTLSPLSKLDYEFGQSDVVGGPMNDLTKVGGDLTLNGTIDVTLTAGGVFDVGLYRVISYDGARLGPGLTVGATPPLAGGSVSVQTSIDGQVNLIKSPAGVTINYWDGPNVAANSKVDGGTGDWRASTTANWTSETGTSNNNYADKAFAIFAAAPGVVTINDADGAVTASGLQFASSGYQIVGDALNLDGATATIRVGDGTGDGVNYVATIDAEIAGASRLVKTDLGTLILTAKNTYSGGTLVSAGKLLINGDQSTTLGNYQVGATGALGGSGVLGGDVTVAGGGILAPGGTSAGTLTINGDLTLGATAQLNYRLGHAGTVGGPLNDLLIVNGDMDLNGVLNVKTSAGGTFGPGIYRLIDYTGTLTGGGLTLGSLPGGTNTIQTSIANQVNLIHAAPAPGGGAGGGGGGTPPTAPLSYTFWDGDAGPAANGAVNGGAGTWSASRGNWTTADGAANGAFTAGKFAIFAAAPGAVSVDAVGGAITVSGMQFASDGYRLSGDGVTLAAGDNVLRVGDGTAAGAAYNATLAIALGGAGGLDKTDAGTLILTGESSYGGGTRISGGTLQLGDGGTSGSISGNVVNNGLLAFNRADDLAFAGAVSGGGLIRQNGAGTLTLNADSSSFGGRTEIRTGTLAVDGALGGRMEVFSGARLIGTGQVGSLVSQAGGIIAPGHSIGTLTVAGDYAGGGTLEIEAVLEGDNSASDRLVVRGATSGVTAVKVLNQGGLGALTTNGIQVVQVDGASNGVFALANGDYRIGAENALIVGAYAYVLRQDGGTGATAGDWLLRSNVTALPTQPLRPADPEAPSQPGAPVSPDQPLITLYQPSVPVYEAYPRALQALNAVGTLRERTSQRQWSGEQDTGVWGRLDGGHARFEPKSSTSLANVTLDSWKVQFGVERMLSDDQLGGRLVGGLTAHYGEAKTEVSSPFGRGDIDTKGYGVGATLTWFGTAGAYVDAQAQASWFDSDLASDILGERANGEGGQGYALSLEVGQVLAAGGSLAFVPQAQLTYSNTDFDSFTDRSGGKVSSDKSDSLQGRLGLALDHEWSGADQDRQANLYGLANLTYEFLDGSRVSMAGTPISSRDERLWGGLGVGGSYGWGQGRYSIYGEASAETPLASFGDSYGFNGTAGFRMTF